MEQGLPTISPHFPCSPCPHTFPAPSPSCRTVLSGILLLQAAGQGQSLSGATLHGKLALHCPCTLSFILTSCFAVSVGSDGLKMEGCILPHCTSRRAVARGRLPSKTGKGAALAIFQTRFPATEDDSITSQKAPAVFTHFVSQADTAPASCVSGKGAAGAALPRGELQLMKVPNYTG